MVLNNCCLESQDDMAMGDELPAMEKNCPGESEKQSDLQSSPVTRTTYHFDRISAANRVGTINSTRTRRDGVED